jgi:trk system potassium uptake protein TrkH
MSKFDSLTHSMTTIATGGFSNYNQSIGYFNSIPIEIASMIFIILGSIPFIAYIKFISGNKKIFLTDIQIKTFFKIIITAILLLSAYLLLNNYENFNLRSVFFNSISILTGTGYVNSEYDSWGSFPITLFLVLMFIGGCAGSTTCGIKIFRIQILYSFIATQLKKIIYPKGVFVIKYDQSSVDDKFIASIISFIYFYFVIFFVLAALLSLTGLDFITAISGAATSISNVGPGLGPIIGPNGDFSSLPDISKWILTIGMILGRLELFAILVLFLPSFWRN